MIMLKISDLFCGAALFSQLRRPISEALAKGSMGKSFTHKTLNEKTKNIFS
jgi:hypothetical protein